MACGIADDNGDDEDGASQAEQYAATLLWPLTNEYSEPYIEDQGLISFHGEQYMNYFSAIAGSLYGNLTAGYDAFWARRHTYLTLSQTVPYIAAYGSDTDWMQINGDFYTRLKGAYGQPDPDPDLPQTNFSDGNG